MPRHFQSKHPWNQQPPSFVFIVLLTAFYRAFNKHSLPAFHHGSQQTEGWKTDGGGEEWSLEETSKLEKSLQMGKEKEHLGFLSPGPKEKTKVMLWRKKSPLPSPEESCADVVWSSLHLDSRRCEAGSAFPILCPSVIGAFQRISISLLSLFYILVESL